MDVLLVESHPGLGCQAERELERAGHRVLRCTTDDGRVPCTGLHDDGPCPIDDHDVAVAVVARLGRDLRPAEHGALCAARHRIPVITTGDVTEAGVLASIASPAVGDIVGAAERAAVDGHAHVAAVVRDLLALGVVAPDELGGPSPALVVEVDRAPRRLVMTLRVRPDEPREAAMVKSAAEALRRHDPHVAVIDVRVEHTVR